MSSKSNVKSITCSYKHRHLWLVRDSALFCSSSWSAFAFTMSSQLSAAQTDLLWIPSAKSMLNTFSRNQHLTQGLNLSKMLTAQSHSARRQHSVKNSKVSSRQIHNKTGTTWLCFSASAKSSLLHLQNGTTTPFLYTCCSPNIEGWRAYSRFAY